MKGILLSVQLPIMSYLLSRNYGNNEMFWWVWKSISSFSPLRASKPPILRSGQLSRNQAGHQLNGIITVKITGIGLLRRWDERLVWVTVVAVNWIFQNFTKSVINWTFVLKVPSSSRQEDHNNLESFRPQVPDKKPRRWVKKNVFQISEIQN